MLKSSYKKVLIGLDGSDQASVAFQKAAAIAAENEAVLYLAHIIDIRALQTYSSMSVDIADTTRREALEELESFKRQAETFGVKQVETLVEFGSPRQAMAHDLPEDHDIDLIVVGATGLNAVERVLIGSVSENITRNAPCDVLVVRNSKN